MRKPPEEEGKRWLQEAEYEFDSAIYLAEGKRYSLACFHCQQASEKALKAYLYSKGEEIVIGHSIVELCENAKKYSADFKPLKTEIGVLDGYYIPTRYPNGLPDSIPSKVYNKEEADKAIHLAGICIDFIKKNI